MADEYGYGIYTARVLTQEVDLNHNKNRRITLKVRIEARVIDDGLPSENLEAVTEPLYDPYINLIWTFPDSHGKGGSDYYICRKLSGVGFSGGDVTTLNLVNDVIRVVCLPQPENLKYPEKWDLPLPLLPGDVLISTEHAAGDDNGGKSAIEIMTEIQENSENLNNPKIFGPNVGQKKERGANAAGLTAKDASVTQFDGVPF